MQACRPVLVMILAASSGAASHFGTTALEEQTARGETQILAAADSAPGDIYGGAVGLSGRFAMVAAEWDDDHGQDSGAVWVFERGEDRWHRTQKLRAPDAEAGDNFGRSIAMDGRTAVIGAHWDDTKAGKKSGSAYVANFDGEQWRLTQKLLAKDGATFDAMGNAVSIHGDWIAVAAWRADGAAANNDGADSGAVHMFNRVDSSWKLAQKLVASDAAANDQFGRGVWISGDALLIGAWHNDARGEDAGAGYLFRLEGGRWSEEQKLTAQDASPGDQLGFSVALEGDVALLGAHTANAGQPGSGAAYAFRFDGKHWKQEQKLIADVPHARGFLGWAVSVQKDVAVLSEHFAFNKAEPKRGGAYVFRRIAEEWKQMRTLTPSDGHPGDVFGFHLALDRERAVIGSWRHNHAGKNSGQAYVFEEL